jgi:hypothetical protein
VGEIEKHLLHRGTSLDRQPQPVGTDAPAVAANLHEIFIGRTVIAENDGHAGHALETDQSDFDSSPMISVAGDDRSDAVIDEIVMRDGLVCSFENLAQLQRDRGGKNTAELVRKFLS